MFEAKKNQNEFVDQFLSMIVDQYEYAATKYKVNGRGQETNDVLCEKYGTNWLLGTMHKYVSRSSNVFREKDAFKIATDLYVLYLKRGFYVCDGGINDPVLNSNYEVKSKNFDSFANKIRNEYKSFCKANKISKLKADIALGFVEQQLLAWAHQPFNQIKESEIIECFICVMQYWIISFDTKCVDKDTWNETKGK